MKLEVGKKYVDRLGGIYKVIRKSENRYYPFHAISLQDSSTERSYTGKGNYYHADHSQYGVSGRDLVKEVDETKEEERLLEPVPDHDGKADQGKIDIDRFFRYFPGAIEAVSEVLQFGAEKYEDGGWVDVPDGVRRYQAAAGRHKLARMKNEIIDKESSLEHWAHELCDHLMAYELYLRGEKSE